MLGAETLATVTGVDTTALDATDFVSGTWDGLFL